MRKLRKHRPTTRPTRPFPSYLETAEQTIDRLNRAASAHVAEHAHRL